MCIRDSAEAIPDAAIMARAEVKRWTIPGSEIRLSRIESGPVSYTHLRAHETVLDLVCRLLLEKKTQTDTIPRL